MFQIWFFRCKINANDVDDEFYLVFEKIDCVGHNRKRFGLDSINNFHNHPNKTNKEHNREFCFSGLRFRSYTIFSWLPYNCDSTRLTFVRNYFKMLMPKIFFTISHLVLIKNKFIFVWLFFFGFPANLLINMFLFVFFTIILPR